MTCAQSGTLAQRMAEVFPWVLALSVTDQDTCARELIDAARASFATGQAHLAMAQLTSWKESATATATARKGWRDLVATTRNATADTRDLLTATPQAIVVHLEQVHTAHPHQTK